MYVVNDSYTAGVQQDDWAITPELCGREQLVTLWARSYNRSTPETVEFLYSEGARIRSHSDSSDASRSCRATGHSMRLWFPREDAASRYADALTL